MRFALKKILLVLFVSVPGVAAAEPWCLVYDAQEYCQFLTANQCYQAINQVGGSCKPNPRELGARGNAPYCVLTGGMKRCIYYDLRRCLDLARSVDGGCVRNIELDQVRREKGLGRDLGCEPGTVACESTSKALAGLDSGAARNLELPSEGAALEPEPENEFAE